MIRISELQYAYPNSDFRLSVDSLFVDDGSKVAIVGPSGSGKSTLLMLMAGILMPSHGAIEVNGVNLGRLSGSERRRIRAQSIGFVLQSLELIDYLSAYENITLSWLLQGQLPWTAAIRSDVQRLAKAVGIDDPLKLKRYPHQLSQGERQRVALCRALVRSPRLVLADEPTGSLDPDNARLALDLLIEQTQRAGTTLVLVTHDHSQLDRFDRVIDMQQLQTSRGAQS